MYTYIYKYIYIYHTYIYVREPMPERPSLCLQYKLKFRSAIHMMVRPSDRARKSFSKCVAHFFLFSPRLIICIKGLRS